MFNTYVLNLDSEYNRVEKQFPELRKCGLDPIRVSGIKGNEFTNHPYLSDLCKITCPYSVIGCALGHYKIYEQFLNNDPNNVCLVLEDDAFPKFNHVDALNQVLFENNSQEWDILKLHFDGANEKACNQTEITGLNFGSTAAYFITKKGAKKCLKNKINTHMDLNLLFLKDLNLKKNKIALFYTDETNSSNRNINWIEKFSTKNHCGEKTNLMFFNFYIFRIPYLNIQITWGQLLLFIIFSVVFCRKCLAS